MLWTKLDCFLPTYGIYFSDNEEMASDLKFYVPIVSLAVFLAIAVGVVIYQRRQISATPSERAPTESTNQQKQTTNTPHYVNLVFTEESHEYRSLNIVEWELLWNSQRSYRWIQHLIKHWNFNCKLYVCIFVHASYISKFIPIALSSVWMIQSMFCVNLMT